MPVGGAPLLSLVLMVVATGWSIALWRRLGDWRGGMFTLLLSAMAAHQFVRVLEWRRTGVPPAEPGWRPEQMHLLVEALLAALAVALLEAAVRGRLTLLARMRQERDLMSRVEMVAGSGSWSWRVGDEALDWSAGMYTLHGRDPASFTPTIDAVRELVIEEDRVIFDATLAAKAGVDDPVEHRITRPGGETRILHTDAVVEQDAAGRPIRAFGAVHDVTSQRAAEDALRTARDRAESAAVARSSFLASMSHEIRTPMTAILGYADLLRERVAEGREAREYVETIRSSGEHLLGLLDDVLDLSKLEAGRVSVESIDFDCVALAEEVVRLFRPRAESKGLSIGVDAPEERLVVRTDPTRVRQILMNLVGNAIKFTERGGVGIRVERGEQIGPRTMVRFSVVDSGIGMSAEQQRRIFDPFRQGSCCTTRRYGGTGLGLAISRRLADLLAGDLRVESTPEEGSAFILEILPAEGDPASLDEPAPGAPNRANEPRLTGRVLLVEDAAVNRRLFRTLLERMGLEVVEAADGAEGVNAADAARREGRPFRLVLMDVEMPVMDGLDATRRLRAIGHTAPIIALTAHAMAGDRERCLEAGCDDYLAKPVDRERLRGMCAAWLETPPLRASA